MSKENRLKILDGRASESVVKDLLARSKLARIAVAYWGKGAVERLGLIDAAKRGVDILVVCDLMSGGCNPEEIRRLMECLGSEKVRAKANLHAKVWLTDAGGVIGSSNASANGFGHEGDEQGVLGLVEANLAFSPLPDKAAKDWGLWFRDAAWQGSDEITEDMLIKARTRWLARRRDRDAINHPRAGANVSLLEKIRSDPEYFREKPFEIWAWEHDGLSDEAKKLLEDQRTQYGNQKLFCYEGCRLKAGLYILDFDWSPNTGKVKYDGLWRVLQDKPYVRRDGTSISLVVQVNNFEGLSLRGDLPAWRGAVAKIMRHVEIDDIEYDGVEFAERLYAVGD